MTPARYSSTKVVLATVLVMLATFIMDSQLPDGVAVAVVYVVAVMMAFGHRKAIFTTITAAACTVLAVVGHVYAPADTTPTVALANLGFAILAIWATALLGLKRRTVEERLARSEAKLGSIIANAGYGIVSIDAKGKIDSTNPAAATMFGYAPNEIIGKSLDMLIDPNYRTDYQDYLISYLNTDEHNVVQRDIEVVGLRKNQSTFPMEVNVREMPSGRGSLIIAMLRDVTERTHIEEERVNLIGELREALAKVKTLGGLIPICSSCKKIRDDQGYWEQVEVYIHHHSDAEFSHGICPDCLERLYPELFPPEKREKMEREAS